MADTVWSKGLHTGTGQVTVQRSSRQKESQKIESKIFYYIRPVPLSDFSRYGTGIDSRVLLREKFVDAFR